MAFPEPLDHALLGHMLLVRQADRSLIVGQVEINHAEWQWQWVPDQPWAAGAYQLLIDTELEDVAGNNLRSPLDVDIRQDSKVLNQDVMTLTFDITP